MFLAGILIHSFAQLVVGIIFVLVMWMVGWVILQGYRAVVLWWDDHTKTDEDAFFDQIEEIRNEFC